jgi:glycine betaine/proline transport system ATP-binding protein
MSKIQIQNLSKIFGKHPKRALNLLDQGVNKDDIFNQTGQAVGLANVCFDVNQGEILVIMGLSGSGKSTLIRCINRLVQPTCGKILIDNQDITHIPKKQLLALRRRKFGMVFQHFALFPHRNILQNTAYGLEIQRIDKKTREQQALDVLKLVGLEGWEHARPHQLSGGMQQRVGLARALAVDPDILLMDEAFSALDPLIRRDMQQELITLQQGVHKTIVFITHDLDEALRIGDRIVLMKDGQVVQIGTPKQIVTQPADQYVARFVENIDTSKMLNIISKQEVAQ